MAQEVNRGMRRAQTEKCRELIVVAEMRAGLRPGPYRSIVGFAVQTIERTAGAIDGDYAVPCPVVSS